MVCFIHGVSPHRNETCTFKVALFLYVDYFTLGWIYISFAFNDNDDGKNWSRDFSSLQEKFHFKDIFFRDYSLLLLLFLYYNVADINWVFLILREQRSKHFGFDKSCFWKKFLSKQKTFLFLSLYLYFTIFHTCNSIPINFLVIWIINKRILE